MRCLLDRLLQHISLFNLGKAVFPFIHGDGRHGRRFQSGRFRDPLIHLELIGNCQQLPLALWTLLGCRFVTFITLPNPDQAVNYSRTLFFRAVQKGRKIP